MMTTLRFWGDRGVDDFRVDVASGLAKDMSEPYPEWERVWSASSFGGELNDSFGDGRHPIFDRDELDDIYSEWRSVFNNYDPPLFAVAEAWVTPHRRGRYASTNGLGQAFNFDLLSAAWDVDSFRTIIRRNVEFAEENGTTSTWVFSNHDVVRHATRYAQERPVGLLERVAEPSDQAAELGLQRARAATLLALALPGSTYVYQGEELGLPEVFGIPGSQAQDPSAVVEDGVVVAGRDGSRVPLPWIADEEFFGFSDTAAHLPQPTWFSTFSVATESADPTSTLTMYRRALELRQELQTDERLQWLDFGEDVVAFARPNGWASVTNFGSTPFALPTGEVILRSDGGANEQRLAPNATAWLALS